jgi:hypothetical protein
MKKLLMRAALGVGSLALVSAPLLASSGAMASTTHSTHTAVVTAAQVAQAQNQALGYNRMFIHARDIDVTSADTTEYAADNEAGGILKGNGSGHEVTLASTGYLYELENDGGSCGPWSGTCFTFYDVHTGDCIAASSPNLIETGCNGGLGCQQFTNPPTNGTWAADWYSGCLWGAGNTTSCISKDEGTDHTFFTVPATCDGFDEGFWQLEG